MNIVRQYLSILKPEDIKIGQRLIITDTEPGFTALKMGDLVEITDVMGACVNRCSDCWSYSDVFFAVGKVNKRTNRPNDYGIYGCHFNFKKA